MPMNHASTEVAPAAMSSCANCHQDAGAGIYYPGNFHSSVANLAKLDPAVSEPTACGSCHAASMPIGFVGPTATSPPRTPPSGEMKHDAVAWANGAPTATSLVPKDCGICHASPSHALDATWATSATGTSPAVFHAALDATGAAQPSSCIDCHANTRPTQLLTSANATVPVGLKFDHASPAAQADCAACHDQSRASGWTSWAAGQFHAAGSATPSTCLPCHESERSTSTAGWANPSYKNSPFDYVTNALGISHGDGQDCASCHAGPGTGAWGGTQNWAAGRFPHGSSTVAATTCIACHTTQRPDLQPGTTAAAAATLIGFDHAQNGTGECFGCHQATVAAGTYVNYVNPNTQKLPNGDWKGGQTYPGSSFASSANQFITVTEWTLNRSGPNNLVTSASSIAATLYNGMLHVSKVLPAPLAAGPSDAPDNSKCWHCHTNNNGTVTAFRDGKFHAALTSYRATPTGTVAPFPQPTSNCADCHASMLPVGIVEKMGASLQAMDHGVSFSGSVTISGVSVTKISQLDCSTCHKSPGSTWSDGTFHANVGAAVPQDCVSCHYMAMADAAKADVKSGTNFTMKHGSPQLTFQGCQTCHPSALSKAADHAGCGDALADRHIPREHWQAAVHLPRVSRGLPARVGRVDAEHGHLHPLRRGDGQQRRAMDEPRVRTGRWQGLRRLSCRRRQGVRQRLEQVGFVPRRSHEGQHLPGVPRPHERRWIGGRYQEQSPGRLDQFDHADDRADGIVDGHSGRDSCSDRPRRRQRDGPRLRLLSYPSGRLDRCRRRPARNGLRPASTRTSPPRRARS